MSLSAEQRAQILYLYQVEGVSRVFIAAMMDLSVAAVTGVVRGARRRDVSAAEKAASRRPSSKGAVERDLQRVQAELRHKGAS